jgi:hypothetical protein
VGSEHEPDVSITPDVTASVPTAQPLDSVGEAACAYPARRDSRGLKVHAAVRQPSRQTRVVRVARAESAAESA